MGVFVGGLMRFASVLGAIAFVIAVVALLLVWIGGIETKSAFMWTFIAGGVLLAGGGAMSAADMGGSDYYWDQEEKESRVSYSFVFIAVGLPLLAVGLLLEAL